MLGVWGLGEHIRAAKYRSLHELQFSLEKPGTLKSLKSSGGVLLHSSR